jgi:nanoRNase/pAp phosphatase (c-di-AMP/oligoRNAs hydrolase)
MTTAALLAHYNAELLDMYRQREEARKQIADAQQAVANVQQQAQQAVFIATENIRRTEGAEAQIRALLTTLAGPPKASAEKEPTP